MTADRISDLRGQLTEDEEMYAIVLFKAVDRTETGEVAVSARGKRMSRALSRYVNACSPAKRFIDKPKKYGPFSGFHFHMDEPVRFAPGYACVLACDLSTMRFLYWNILQEAPNGWEFVEYHATDTLEKIDLEAYGKKRTEANKTFNPTPGTVPRNLGGSSED